MTRRKGARVNIQIVQDLICPWCYIGHHNLETAISELGMTDDVTFEWFPYQLDPITEGAPAEGFRERFTQRKGMSAADMQAMFDRVTEVGRTVGLEFRFDRVTVAVDTIPGHAAIAAAPVHRRNALVSALHAAYFTRGQDIGHTDVILAAAREAGLDDNELEAVATAVASPEARAAVRATVRSVQMAGVTSVPYFNVGDRYGLSGGQPVAVFKQALDQAREPVGAAS